MAADVAVEQLGRVRQVDLVDVVVDGAALVAGEMRDREAVVGEAGQPQPPVEADQVLHQVDLVDARLVAHLLDRPDHDALGPVLGRLAADEDAHGRLCLAAAGLGRLEHHPYRLGPQLRLPGIVLRLQDASDHAADLIFQRRRRITALNRNVRGTLESYNGLAETSGQSPRRRVVAGRRLFVAFHACFDRCRAPGVRQRRHGARMPPSPPPPTEPQMLISPGAAVPAAQPTRSHAVVVLGVGRSGTSAITRGVQALGVELGDRLRRHQREESDRLLRGRPPAARSTSASSASCGIAATACASSSPTEWQAPAVRALQQEAIETVRQRFGQLSAVGLQVCAHAAPVAVLARGVRRRSTRRALRRRDAQSAERRALARAARSAARHPGAERPGMAGQCRALLPRAARAPVRRGRTSTSSWPSRAAARAHRPRPRSAGDRRHAGDAKAYADEFLRPGMRHSRLHGAATWAATAASTS